MNEHKKIWLDLELREDIDDFATLIHALENNVNISEISIHNPSKSELILACETLKRFGKNIPLIVSGQLTIYPDGKDINPSLFKYFDEAGVIEYVELSAYLSLKPTFEDKIVFCGGSLYTLSKLVEFNDGEFLEAFIQGGFAGESVVGSENVLKKFRKREAVPTWNLNIDVDATDRVLLAKNVSCHFVSKNICHASWVKNSDVAGNSSVFCEVVGHYFTENSSDKKCMHDLVAFLSIFNDTLVKFKPVRMHRTTDERPKWHSVITPDSNHFISYSLDYEMFIKLVTKA